MTDHPVPQSAARLTSRYDTDPDALAWARAKVQHYIDRLAKFEEHATDSNSSNKARGLRVARRSAEQTLIGGEGCVVGAFDERRPVMLGGAAPAEQATADPAVRLTAAATHLRTLANAATPGPWSRPLNTRYKASVSAPLPEGEQGAWLTGIDPETGKRERVTVVAAPTWSNGKHTRKRSGRDLEYIAAVGPQVGALLVAWLDSAAFDAQMIGVDPEALAVADAILGASQ